MEIHHIVGGAGRKDLPSGGNFILLCGRCHHAVHARLPLLGEIPKGSVLWAKEEEDGEVDVTELANLRHRKALPYDKRAIPDTFLAERDRHGGDPWP